MIFCQNFVLNEPYLPCRDWISLRSSMRRMRVYSKWWKETETLLFIFIIISLAHLQCVHSADDVLRGSDPNKTPQSGQYTVAEITISYKDKESKETKKHFQGKFGLNSLIRDVKGIVRYAESKSKHNKKNNWGCDKYSIAIPTKRWIALVERGQCHFSTKVKIATSTHNASAVVVFDGDGNGPNTDAIMNQGEKDSTSVFISNRDGKALVRILEKDMSIKMHIVPGKEVPFNHSQENNISKTSVLFVSISFIVLMIISLAWLVFYYIQRFRYTHAKERLARRLACAAKKAIAKIPQSTVKAGDKVLEGDHDQCAVCIEQYKLHDVIRVLPCTHVFHKSCVDPWLQENRSCPMCKMDILAAYGMQIGTSQESVQHNAEGATTQLVMEDPEVSSSLEETAAPTDVVLPFICLHTNREDVQDEEEETQQPSSQLLGAGLSSENIRSSVSSLHSNNSNESGKGISSSLSRVKKRDKQESTSIEMKALIKSSDDLYDANVVSDNGSGGSDWKSKKNVDRISRQESGEEDMCSLSSSSCELRNSANNKRDGDGDHPPSSSSSSTKDSRSNKDTVSIIVLDTGGSGGGDSVGAVEFHQEQDLSPTDSFSHA